MDFSGKIRFWLQRGRKVGPRIVIMAQNDEKWAKPSNFSKISKFQGKDYLIAPKTINQTDTSQKDVFKSVKIFSLSLKMTEI